MREARKQCLIPNNIQFMIFLYYHPRQKQPEPQLLAKARGKITFQRQERLKAFPYDGFLAPS